MGTLSFPILKPISTSAVSHAQSTGIEIPSFVTRLGRLHFSHFCPTTQPRPSDASEEVCDPASKSVVSWTEWLGRLVCLSSRFAACPVERRPSI